MNKFSKIKFNPPLGNEVVIFQIGIIVVALQYFKECIQFLIHTIIFILKYILKNIYEIKKTFVSQRRSKETKLILYEMLVYYKM